MTFIAPSPARPACRLLCLDLVAGELKPEDPNRPAPYRIAVENNRRMLEFARASGWPVIHVHRRSGPADAFRPVEGFRPLPRERVLYRPGLSAFSNRAFRRAIRADPNAELVILGFSLSAAHLATALTARDWNVPVTLIEDGFQPADGEGPDVGTLHAVAQALAAPLVRLATTESFIGPRRRLHLVQTRRIVAV
jgi:nicotinamidase-related amidase